MKLLRKIIDCFIRIFHSEKPEVQLEAVGPTTVLVLSGQHVADAITIETLDEKTGKPLSGQRVVFTVLEGEITIEEQDSKQVTKQTNGEGQASISLRMGIKGNGLILTELENDTEVCELFIIRSEGIVNELNFYCPGIFDVDKGKVTATVVATDHQGMPVNGANLIFEGHTVEDLVVDGSVTEIGNGLYQGIFETKKAGEWGVMVQDTMTNVAVQKCIHILPGKPATIELLEEPDPRAAPPYNQVMLRAQLLDNYGNPLDPHEISCHLDNNPIERSIVGSEARFALKLYGHGYQKVVLSSRDNAVTLDTTIHFAAMWMENPGLVEPGTRFRTKVFVSPEQDKSLTKATIKVRFDTEQVSFVKVLPVEESGIHVSFTHEQQDDQLIIHVNSEKEIPSYNWTEGIAVIHIEWDCLDEGEACFDIEGSMSPDIDGWRICIPQKSRRENIQCVCINLIYRQIRRRYRRIGTAMVRQAMRVISGNIYFCCPVMKYQWNFCELSNRQWIDIRQAFFRGNNLPRSRADLRRLLRASGYCKKSDCINIYIIPIQNPRLHGYTRLSTGAMVIDPRSFQGLQNLAAHEFGHALGLDDSRDRANVMYEASPHGGYISYDQCKTIWQNLNRYPCD